MDAVLALMNAVFLAFIVSTMLNVGLVTSIDQLTGILRNARWLAAALVASLVAVPLIGWGVAEVFPLEGAAYVALVLVACSPGAPFAVALTTIQRGDVVAGAASMAILAVVGSLTTPLTVDFIIGAGEVAEAGGGSIKVGELVLSIVALQIVPFAVGMAMKAWVPDIAVAWQALVKKISSVTFGLVILSIVIGGFQQVIDLIGSWILVASLVASLGWLIAGAVLAPAPRATRVTGGILASSRNAGPVLLIATASFADVEGVIPATISVFIVLLVTQVVVASWFGKRDAKLVGEALPA